jgi:hypothetical protein
MLGFGDDARVDDDVAGGHFDSMALISSVVGVVWGGIVRSGYRVDVLSLGYEWVFKPCMYSTSNSKQQQRNEL